MQTKPHAKSAAIVGARGYAGLALARLLLKHPAVELTHAFATQEFELKKDVLSAEAARVTCLPDSKLMENLTDLVFLATPAEVSMKLAPAILAKGKTVIDLSGGFRLKSHDYMKWYAYAHTAPNELKAAEYGLVPFVGPYKGAKLIANPGCYASAIALGAIPLLKKGLIKAETLVIDAKSGTTGAGRKAVEGQLFAEVDGECLPYRVGKHQHLPEIQEAVAAFTGAAIDPHFVTHLLPAKRGIVAGLYAEAKTDKIEDIEAAYAEAFQGYPLVRFGRDVATLGKLAQVVNTPYTHISYELVGKKLYVFSLIDNLLKGAASQAVENMNRALDLAVDFGLQGEM